VVGLFVAVQGLENLGVVDAASAWLSHLQPGSPEKLLATAAATGAASNVLNNLPAALIARSVLTTAHAHTGTILAALIGADVGAVVTPFGSLATMLVLTIARTQGESVRPGRLVAFGLCATPIILVTTTAALIVSFALVSR
jgi:arsenical pump membrane protein